MSWKVSMLLIKNDSNEKQDEKILQALGWNDFAFVEETTLSETLFPRDGSISIGYYNNAIVICEDLQFSRPFCTNDYVTKEEQSLCELFPNKEIMSINCNGTHNAHGYSLTKNGKKFRYKFVMEGFPKCEGGTELKEEEEIYQKAFSKENNIYQWKFDSLPETVFLENQLMEEFTFKVGKRILGIELGTAEDDELMSKIAFKKYKKLETPQSQNLNYKEPINKESSSDSKENNTLSRIISFHEEMIVLEEFSTIRWQAKMYSRINSLNNKIRIGRKLIIYSFVIFAILGFAFTISFLLKFIGFPMGGIYWTVVFLFLIFILSRVYKVLSKQAEKDYLAQSVLDSAKSNNMDIEKVVRRIVRFKPNFIEWERNNGQLTTVTFLDMIFAQMDEDVIIIASKVDNLVNTIKLSGLSKEDKYQIKNWMKKKSNDNRQFKWTDLT